MRGRENKGRRNCNIVKKRRTNLNRKLSVNFGQKFDLVSGEINNSYEVGKEGELGVRKHTL